MRSKYFLRGMGVGILVTVIIFAVSLVFYEPTLSDEEIIEKAKALGMETSEETTTKEDSQTKDEEASNETDGEEQSTDTSTEEESDHSSTDASTEENSDHSSADASTDEDESGESESQDNNSSSNETASESSSSSERVTFVVTPGEGSSKICENLYHAGLIDDPNTFNQFLEDNGYDKTISTGSYEIPKGSTYEEIANAISH